MTEQVILVDKHDNELGYAEKMEVHRTGTLHRAFSAIIFNAAGEILLQKRAATKYHSAGLWTNTCCSHPRPGETLPDAVHRRLLEEMGIDLTPNYVYKFIYQTTLDNNLIEHELDHVFIGEFNGVPQVNTQEVSEWKFISVERVKEDIASNPHLYTHWFKLIVNHPEFNNIIRS